MLFSGNDLIPRGNDVILPSNDLVPCLPKIISLHNHSWISEIGSILGYLGISQEEIMGGQSMAEVVTSATLLAAGLRA
jgi:hypothetical protein